MPNGEWVEPRYDDASQPYSLLWWTAQHGWNAYVTGTSYTALGQLAVQTYGNGTYRQHTYDPTSFRLSSLWVGAPNQSGDQWPLWKDFGYDAVGNLAWEKDFRENYTGMPGGYKYHHIAYSYDALDRLTSAATAYNTTSQPAVTES